MTGRERVLAALAGMPTDVPAALSITSTATVEAMRKSKSFFPDAHTNPISMAALAAESRDQGGLDSVSPYFSIHLEAAALGAKINWSDPAGTPFVVGHALSSLEDLTLPEDFCSLPIPSALIRTIGILRNRYRDNVAVIGKVIGPWTILYHLHGVENLLLDTLLDPVHTKEILMILSAIPITFAKAQFAAGADAVVWADHVTSDLVSAALYEETLYPVHRAAAEELNQFGPIILHCCGNVEDRMKLFSTTGFSCFHADSRNNIEKLISDSDNRIRLAGFVNNPVVLSQYSPRRVAAETGRILSKGITMPCPECAIPTSVTSANLRAVTSTLHSYRFRYAGK